MSTIHQCLTLPAGGSALSLGPVTVVAAYPADKTPKGIDRRNIEVQDASGKTKMTLWREAALLPINKGETITLKGEIKPNEYNGNVTLAATKITVERAGGGSAAPASGGGSFGNKDAQIMRQNALAHSTSLVVASGVSNVFDAQRTVLELAVVFAKYSETGETGIPELPEAEPNYSPE